MSPNAYAAAKRLATDPGATQAERENARARCREHEEAQRRAAPPPPPPPPRREPASRPFRGGVFYVDLMRDLFTDFGVDLGGSYSAAQAHDGKAEADRTWREAQEKAKQEEEPTGAWRPFHERPRPPSIVRPSAEDVKRYGVPEVKPEPDRVRAATWDETVRYSAAGGVDAPPREPKRPDIDLKEAAQTWAERRWGPGR